MAELRVVEDSPSRLVLGTPLAQRLPNLVTFLVLILVGFSVLSPLFEGGLAEDPTLLLVLLFFGFFGLRSLYALVVTTTVSIDATARQATRSRSVLGAPIARTSLAFERIKQVLVGSRAPVIFNQTRSRPGWLVALESTDAPAFLVNSNGTHDEMLAVGNKISALSNKPLTDELEVARNLTEKAPDLPPIQDFGGGASTTIAPPIALPSPMGGLRPGLPRLDTLPPPNTLAADSESPEHARFEQQASQLDKSPSQSGETGSGMPATIYSAPPALELPYQPPLGSAPPVETAVPEMPSALEEPPRRAPTVRRNLQQLQQAVADDPTDSVASFQLARMLQTRGSLNQSMEMYQLSARLDPMNGAIQNDMGVLFFQQRKLKDAELAFRRAVGLDPFSVYGHYNLGLVFARTGRGKEADQEFNRVEQNAESDDDRRLAGEARNGRYGPPILSNEG